MIGPMAETSQGNRFIIVATDYLTKWPEARATSDETAETAAKFLYEDILTRHGAPKELLSDRGRTFVNKTVAELCKRLEVRQTLASAYHPQTNGLVERFNGTLIETLAKLCNRQPREWDKMIPAALFAYRTAQHETTKRTPLDLLYGRKATYPLETVLETQPRETPERTTGIAESDRLLRQALRLYDLMEIRNNVRERIRKDQQRQQVRYNKTVRPQEYQPGNLVLVHETAKAKTRTDKLAPKWTGPYRIHSVLGKGVYRLTQLNGTIDDRPFHAKRLKLYYEPVTWEPHVIVDTPAPFLGL
jgi:transposase InsO family protein